MEILIIGIARGALYSLIAVGFVLVFSVGGILNLAHGTFFMLGAYFTYIFYRYLFNQSGELQLVFSMILAIGAVGLLSVWIYMILLRKRIQTISFVMIMSIAIALFTSELMALLYGVTGTAVPPLLKGGQEIFGVRVIKQELLLIPVAAFTLIGLWFFLKHTRLGRSLDAVAQNREGAIYMGVNTNMVFGITMGLSAALAATAGTLISSLVTVVPYMWVFPLIKAFAIAISGGLGSIPGAIIASFIVSFAEVITVFTVSEQFSEMVSLFIIVLILIFKPQGLMGAKV
jgi:branched-chain amino acid transport system permease protein